MAVLFGRRYCSTGLPNLKLSWPEFEKNAFACVAINNNAERDYKSINVNIRSPFS